MHKAGFTIIAEKLNYARYISHFRSVHRGAYFAEMKISSVRKLLPDSWGFLCPVNTPDGALCGLLNHLTSSCQPIPSNCEFSKMDFIKTCVELGMKALGLSDLDYIPGDKDFTVVLDG